MKRFAIGALTTSRGASVALFALFLCSVVERQLLRQMHYSFVGAPNVLATGRRAFHTHTHTHTHARARARALSWLCWTGNGFFLNTTRRSSNSSSHEFVEPPCSKSRFLFSGALRPAPSPRPPSCDKRYPPTLVEFVELSHTLTHSLAAATVCVRVAPAVCLSTTLRRLWCRDTLPRASTYPFRRPREIIGPATETPRCCPAAGPSC